MTSSVYTPDDPKLPQQPGADEILASILDYVPTGITVAFGRDAVIHSVSKYGLDLIGREESEVTKIGAERHPDAWQVLDADGVTPTKAQDLPLTRACAGEVVRSEELFLRSSTGKLIPVLCNAGPVTGPGGNVIGGVIAWSDVSLLREALAEKATSAREAEAARQAAETATVAKDYLLAKVAHELRSPLSAVLGWASIARAMVASPTDVAKALDIIERNAKMQSRIVEDLIDLNRALSGKLEVDLLEVHLESLAASAVDSVRPFANEKGVELATSLQPAVVSGDQVRLQQILSNLLTNAVKFSPRGSVVTVELAPQDSRAILKVTDTGQGMSAEHCEKAFEPFWQAEAGEGHKAGLGLGLAICQGMVRAHGGQVWAHSSGPGSGCTFTVELPLRSVPTS